MEVEQIISGLMFLGELPQELREKVPPRCKRIVIDIPYNGPVRILYEAHATESLKSFIEAALRAGYVEDPAAIKQLNTAGLLGAKRGRAYRTLVEDDKASREECAAYTAGSPEERAWRAGFAECERIEQAIRDGAAKGTDDE